MIWCQIISLSSQLVTIPCSIGIFSISTPRLVWASSIPVSHFWMESMTVAAMPKASFPIEPGWNLTSAQRKRSFPIVTMLPSGSE